jgi:hypothetical protein
VATTVAVEAGVAVVVDVLTSKVAVGTGGLVAVDVAFSVPVAAGVTLMT